MCCLAAIKPLLTVRFSVLNVDELSRLQVCQKLLKISFGLNSREARCFFCPAGVYSVDHEEDSIAVRCSECARPGHADCVRQMFSVLPRGFFWICPECEDPSEAIKTTLQTLKSVCQTKATKRQLLKPNEGKQLTIKNEPDDEDQFSNFASGDDDITGSNNQNCIPTRGFLCDVCDFSSYDQNEFLLHVESEERLGNLVQESIATKESIRGRKQCSKCEESYISWSKLYDHVLKNHSKQADFPTFGDAEWKFIMAGGTATRNCCYCQMSFSIPSHWINHMHHGMLNNYDDEDAEELMADAMSKVQVDVNFGLDDLDQDSGNEKNGAQLNLGTDMLKCEECDQDQIFSSADALRIHVNTFHRKTKRFLCAFCDFDGNSVGDLKDHVNSEHEGNFNNCTECEFKAWAHSVLRRHINIKHCNMKAFGCKHCDYTSMSKATLMSHIVKKHKKSSKQTSVRRRKTKRKRQYEDDDFIDDSYLDEDDEDADAMIPAKRPVKFKCCFCEFISHSKKSFQNHLDDIHEGNRTQCLECDFKAPIISHLRRHIDSVHKGLKKFACNSCDFRATTKQSLDRHVRVKHMDLKDLMCAHCDYRTSAPDLLRIHKKKYHSDDNGKAEDIENADLEDDGSGVKKERIYFGNRTPIPMVCRICGQGCQTTNKLAAHFADCHPYEKPFWCHECNIGYETYYGIQNHRRKDHSEERHLCPICGYSTHGPQYLKRHYRRVSANFMISRVFVHCYIIYCRNIRACSRLSNCNNGKTIPTWRRRSRRRRRCGWPTSSRVCPTRRSRRRSGT